MPEENPTDLQMVERALKDQVRYNVELVNQIAENKEEIKLLKDVIRKLTREPADCPECGSVMIKGQCSNKARHA